MPPDPVARPASIDSLLAFAWDSAEFTATDAMAVVRLTRSTTIDAIDTLVRLGLLQELPNARETGDYRKGRPARRFELRADAGVLVGVDAGPQHITVTVADLRSRPLVTHRAILDPDHAVVADRRDAIGATVDTALEAAGRSRAEVLAICAGVAAPVNARGISPSHPNGFWRQTNPGLAELFAAWTPVVRIENDASLAAIAEGSVGAAVGCGNYVTLLAGARLGAGVVVDGRVLRGAHGGVGEMVAFDHVAGVGSPIGLGHRAEQWAREAIASKEAAPGGALASMPADRIDGQAVLELARDGDADACRIVERLGRTLARIVSVLGSMFDPERVIVCGAISAGVVDVVAAARRALPTDLDLPAPQILASRLGADIVVRGAVAAAAEDARSTVLDRWMTAVPAGEPRPNGPGALEMVRRHARWDVPPFEMVEDPGIEPGKAPQVRIPRGGPV